MDHVATGRSSFGLLFVQSGIPLVYLRCYVSREKTALPTGGGSGIGRAMANLFARQGALIWVSDINVMAGQETAYAICQAGGRAEFAEVDASDPAAVTALMARVQTFDILVNNADIGHVGSLLDTSAADRDRLHAVKVRGASACAGRLCMRCWKESAGA